MAGSLEAELRARFAVREERFAHGGWEVELILPLAADELIDLSEAQQHALLREVVVDDLLPGERASLHLALARALEARAEGLPGHGGAHLAPRRGPGLSARPQCVHAGSRVS